VTVFVNRGDETVAYEGMELEPVSVRIQ
jgi:hypothetical protein